MCPERLSGWVDQEPKLTKDTFTGAKSRKDHRAHELTLLKDMCQCNELRGGNGKDVGALERKRWVSSFADVTDVELRIEENLQQCYTQKGN